MNLICIRNLNISIYNCYYNLTNPKFIDWGTIKIGLWVSTILIDQQNVMEVNLNKLLRFNCHQLYQIILNLWCFNSNNIHIVSNIQPWSHLFNYHSFWSDKSLKFSNSESMNAYEWAAQELKQAFMVIISSIVD